MSIEIPKMVKADYANLLALLHRVEAKGLAEMHEVVALGAKLKHKVETWVEDAETTLHLKADPPSDKATPVADNGGAN